MKKTTALVATSQQVDGSELLLPFFFMAEFVPLYSTKEMFAVAVAGSRFDVAAALGSGCAWWALPAASGYLSTSSSQWYISRCITQFGGGRDQVVGV